MFMIKEKGKVALLLETSIRHSENSKRKKRNCQKNWKEGSVLDYSFDPKTKQNKNWTIVIFPPMYAWTEAPTYDVVHT